MGIYLTMEFDQERRRVRISDKTLCKTAAAIIAGLHGDRLGKFTYKKRIALPAVSSRDGARAIVFFHEGDNLFFFDMYVKSELSKKKGKELEEDEIDAYCAVAKDFMVMPEETLARLLKSDDLIEVKCHE
ncbi:type II toxin-antitoxin system RelE/ParE family toxin [Kosakonia sp. ML.JS2a]|uniref:type II toxin-antitoxin system RelE/ParE family toxin n=1 Tax=Kosakonia sp. ML.JS2a TaxID=2980557 RepID=UPI0021DAB4A2|nr:type II toxin-antitoxin system RelE/ParE family toxin [Kosakonia sp. ML.JS2a]UXY11254.1 type II toxin-antitoxin system RelE/ParE family toxin [Kosakonia sp. ML.JS2a]